MILRWDSLLNDLFWFPCTTPVRPITKQAPKIALIFFCLNRFQFESFKLFPLPSLHKPVSVCFLITFLIIFKLFFASFLLIFLLISLIIRLLWSSYDFYDFLIIYMCFINHFVSHFLPLIWSTLHAVDFACIPFFLIVGLRTSGSARLPLPNIVRNDQIIAPTECTYRMLQPNVVAVPPQMFE